MLKSNNGTVLGGGESEICPDETLLGRFVLRSLDPVQMEAIALHIMACPRCKDIAKDMAEWIVAGRTLDVDAATPEERKVVNDAYGIVRAKYVRELWHEVFAAVRPRREYLAAADGQTDDQIQQETAMRSGFIHFVSCTSPGHKDAWHAKWAVPTTVSDDTYLRLQVFDGSDKPINTGVLIFCGVELEIADGYAFMSIKSFRKNIGKSLIALKTADGRIIEGEPVRAKAYDDTL